MERRNYTKSPDGITIVGRPRGTNECSWLGLAQLQNEAVEKDASTFPLATAAACLTALRALYGELNEEVIKAINDIFKKRP